jgi:hypothetical protein
MDRWDLLHALELFIKREYVVLGVTCSIDYTFAYSLTHFSKNFVLPWREIVSIHVKGLATL